MSSIIKRKDSDTTTTAQPNSGLRTARSTVYINVVQLKRIRVNKLYLNFNNFIWTYFGHLDGKM